MRKTLEYYRLPPTEGDTHATKPRQRRYYSTTAAAAAAPPAAAPAPAAAAAAAVVATTATTPTPNAASSVIATTALPPSASFVHVICHGVRANNPSREPQRNTRRVISHSVKISTTITPRRRRRTQPPKSQRRVYLAGRLEGQGVTDCAVIHRKRRKALCAPRAIVTPVANVALARWRTAGSQAAQHTVGKASDGHPRTLAGHTTQTHICTKYVTRPPVCPYLTPARQTPWPLH